MPPTRPRPRRRSLWWSRSAPSPRRPPTRRPSSSTATTGPSRPPFAPSTTTRKSTPMSPIRHPSPRQPVRLRAPHHAPRHHRRPPPYRRARAMFSCAHVRAHHNPEQRRQDHSPGAGPHWPDHQVARLLHHRAGPRRRDRSRIQPELHAGRVPRGRERPRDRDEDMLENTKFLQPHTHVISFEKRQALVTYLENNKAGITVFRFTLDLLYLHTIFMLQWTLFLWLLGKTVGFS